MIENQKEMNVVNIDINNYIEGGICAASSAISAQIK